MRLDDSPKFPEYYETCDLRRNNPQWFPAYFDYVPPSTCFDPGTLAIASLAATAIGTGVSIMGSMQQASATKSAADYQSQVAKNNQKIAEDNAAYERQAGQVAAEAQGRKTAALIGTAEAAQGASGIDPTTGSPANVVRSIRETGRLDTLNLVQNAELAARSSQIKASNFGAEAQLETMKGQQAQTAGLYSAGSSLLAGASSFGDKWLGYQQKGAFGGNSTGGWSARGTTTFG